MHTHAGESDGTLALLDFSMVSALSEAGGRVFTNRTFEHPCARERRVSRTGDEQRPALAPSFYIFYIYLGLGPRIVRDRTGFGLRPT